MGEAAGHSGERVRTRRTATSTIDITPSPWQTDVDIEEDFAGFEALAEELIEGGTQAWKAHYRWWGPVKLLAYKEVGPPPWRFPKVGFNHKGKTVRVIVGWRSTAFAVLAAWKPKRGHNGGSVTPP